MGDITIKLSDLLWVFGTIVSIVAFIKAVEYLKDKSSVTKLSKRLDEHDKKLQQDYEHFQANEHRLNGIEKRLDNTDHSISELNESVNLIGKSMLYTINHNIDGNGIEELKKIRKDMTEYFIK